MKKQMLKSALIAVACVGFMAGSALALPAEYEIINPTDLTGSAINSPGYKFGYYITSDASRTNWTIKWEDDTHSGDLSTLWHTFFSGSIQLENATGEFSTLDFEWLVMADHFVVNSNDTNGFFTSWILNEEDGIQFTISQTAAPSFVAFDLFYDGGAMNSNNIYLGAIGQTVNSLGGDHDFAIAAPVPEPTTMLLFGAGLAGLAAIGRRRKD